MATQRQGTKADTLLSIAQGFRNFQQNKRAGKLQDARIAGEELKRNLEIRRFQLQEANFKEQSKNASARLELDTERNDLFKQQQAFSQNLATQTFEATQDFRQQTFEAGREDVAATQDFRQQQLTRLREQDALSAAQTSEASALAGLRATQQQGTALDRLQLGQQRLALDREKLNQPRAPIFRNVDGQIVNITPGATGGFEAESIFGEPRAQREAKQDFSVGRQTALAGFAQLFEDSLLQVGKKRLARDDLEARSNAASTILDDVARLAAGQGITRDEILATIATGNPELFRKHLQNIPLQAPQNAPALAPDQPTQLQPTVTGQVLNQPTVTPPIPDATQDLTRVGAPTAQVPPQQQVFPPGSPEAQIDQQAQAAAAQGDALLAESELNRTINGQRQIFNELVRAPNPDRRLQEQIIKGSIVQVKNRLGGNNAFIVEVINGDQIFVQQISTGQRFTAKRNQLRFKLTMEGLQ